jgi:Tol biopolymer transport system component
VGAFDWSPDGLHLAYTWLAQEPEWGHYITMANADGSEPRSISTGWALEGYNPPPPDIAWSPDGTLLVYISKLSQGLTISLGDYADTVYEGIGGLGFGRVYDSAGVFSWSPDSRKILFPMNSSGRWEIYTALLDKNPFSQSRLTIVEIVPLDVSDLDPNVNPNPQWQPRP